MKSTQRNSEEEAYAERDANPGYALGQLAKAFSTSQAHPDSDTRERATRKIANWLKVFKGMLSGALNVGSRTPVGNVPAWATLEIVHGGFATGELLAAGALQPHEEALLAQLAVPSTAPPRAILNGYFLSDEGIAELQQMLETGCYRVQVPEEGTLLVIAWMLANGQPEAAWEILDAISPYLDKLRFYPIPASEPLSESTLVHLNTVGQTIQDLQRIKTRKELLAQREAFLIWGPLCDRAVELFLETLEGPAPTLTTGADGKPLRNAEGKLLIEGGWPCQRYPEGWKARTRTFLEDYQQLRKNYPLCGKSERKGENFTLLRKHLEVCLQDPRRLTGCDVGRIRLVLANIAHRRGLPTSERCQQLRRFQADLANRPNRVELAKVVIDRMAKLPQEEGLSELDTALAPVTAEEAGKYGLETGQTLATRLEGKVRRCLVAPVEVLVAQKIIPSGEVMATVIPQITAQVSASGLTDPELRRLYKAIYQAFRRRRSLLLLNLQNQVKLTELPWMKAIGVRPLFVKPEQALGAQELARQTLEQIVGLALTAFPQQILPNKLLQELRALVEKAGLRIPLVDEVAADIFMGAFSEKFLHAAQIAARLLQGSLYARYYDIPYDLVLRIADVKPSRYGGTPTSAAFFQLCSERAGTASGGSWVARNGTIIEQEQILTTHNLAALFDALGPFDTLAPHLYELAQHCFIWVCKRFQQPCPHWQARLQMVKNTAYAWRQMLFFLSLVSEEEVRTFLAWASDHLGQQRPEFQTRFQPALEGVARAFNGLSPEVADSSEDSISSRRFLGWTTGSHWLLT